MFSYFDPSTSVIDSQISHLTGQRTLVPFQLKQITTARTRQETNGIFRTVQSRTDALGFMLVNETVRYKRAGPQCEFGLDEKRRSRVIDVARALDF